MQTCSDLPMATRGFNKGTVSSQQGPAFAISVMRMRRVAKSACQHIKVFMEVQKGDCASYNDMTLGSSDSLKQYLEQS